MVIWVIWVIDQAGFSHLTKYSDIILAVNWITCVDNSDLETNHGLIVCYKQLMFSNKAVSLSILKFHLLHLTNDILSFVRVYMYLNISLWFSTTNFSVGGPMIPRLLLETAFVCSYCSFQYFILMYLFIVNIRYVPL